MSSEKSSKKGKVDASKDDELQLIDDAEEIEGDDQVFEEPNPHADITLLLKELAEHQGEPYEQIAQEMELPRERARP